MNKPLLMLLDGNSLVHRAYHAVRQMTMLTSSRTGEPTGAVYVFTRMLLKLLQDHQPDYWAAAFDRPVPTFRHLQFEEYKAQRERTPDDLVAQFKRVRELVAALRMPVFELDGFEADDVIAALARQAAAQGLNTLIVSGDNDMLQLAAPRVQIELPRRSLSETMVYDEAAVLQRYGVSPQQLPDLKALIGDVSDNIPGVPGVGEKTAARLLQQFETIDGIYQHLAEISPPRIQEALTAAQERVRQNLVLVTIESDLPLTFESSCCARGQYDREKLVALFHELEFHSLLATLPEVEKLFAGLDRLPAVCTPAQKIECRVLASSPELAALAARLERAPSCVIAALSAQGRLVGLGLAPAPGETYYLPLGHPGLGQPRLEAAQVIQTLGPFFQDQQRAKVAHGSKDCMAALSSLGIGLGNVRFDTMIAAYLLGEKSVTLQALAYARLGTEVPPVTSALAKRQTVPDLEANLVAGFVRDEMEATAALCESLERELKERELWQLYTEVEMPLVAVLARMERNGVALDTRLLREMSQSLGRDLQRTETEIYERVGHDFNINSPQQLGAVLFGELKLAGGKKTKTGYSTAANVLDELKDEHPVVRLVLEYRQLSKLKSTYVDTLPGLIDPRTGRLHTSFNQTVTTTGRLSSSDPNLQNIPVRGELGQQVRQAFIAPEPCLLLGGDYSQVELRLLAHMSQDPILLEAFRQNRDIHASTAALVFDVPLEQVTPEMRRVAKVVNFGVIYGMSEYGLGQATDFSWEKASSFIDAYFEKHQGVRDYLESLKKQARELGYVNTLMGRRRYVPEVNSLNRMVREAAERTAINMPLQGTAADIIKVAMVRLQRKMDERHLASKMILQVHDELLFEVPPEEMDEMKGLMLDEMCNVMQLSVPLKVEAKVGKSWGEMA